MRKIDEIVKESKPTLAVFVHAGNQDAVDVKYLINELRTKFADKARIERVDSSYDGELKMQYKLREYPTYILFKEGQELMRESGRKTEAQLEDMIQRAL
ncbi:MAG: thioredoxin family protein [Muribaculaceae bacterium]|nr:thioredoxin family protein [Muribaculaceae bacterium]